MIIVAVKDDNVISCEFVASQGTLSVGTSPCGLFHLKYFKENCARRVITCSATASGVKAPLPYLIRCSTPEASKDGQIGFRVAYRNHLRTGTVKKAQEGNRSATILSTKFSTDECTPPRTSFGSNTALALIGAQD